MIRRWVPGTLVAVFAGLLSIVVSGAVAGPAPARTPEQQSLVLHLRWRLVTRELNSIATSDRYLALLTYPDPQTPYDSGSVILRDEQIKTQQLVALPSACVPNRAPREFGGPWLVVACRGASYWLYNLSSQQWVAVSPKCPADCGFVGVGRYWLKVDSNENPGCSEHCGESYFLQNLQTGQVEPDPAKPGGRTFDDLNSPSGVVPLCAPLRYPTFDVVDLGTQVLGSLQLSGTFALAGSGAGAPGGALSSFHHLRCGSKRALGVQNASPHFAPFISSRAVVSLGLRQDHCKKRPFGLACTNHYYIRGVYLRGLRQFTASLPTTTVPQYSWPGEVVGLTRRTIYVQAPYPNGPLWAATLPQPRSPRRQ